VDGSRMRDLIGRVRPWFVIVLLVLTVLALASGSAAWLAGRSELADACWIVGTLMGLVPAIGWVIRALAHGRAGVDLIAVLALAGSLGVGEFVAGALIAVMLATGRALDAAAERRASQDLRALLERAPRTARRRVGVEVREVPLEEVQAGDVLMVGPGEIVPVDGVIDSGLAVLDESALTGEAVPVERATGENVRSGVLNAGQAFELRAGATAANSTYAGVISLVQQASAGSAPVVRLADRYATWFLPLSLAMAGGAGLISGSLVRAVAVLVVATPCPLLLAAPVAIVSGLSRASRIGVVIRSGVALESLGRARTMVIDKTGTLTAGLGHHRGAPAGRVSRPGQPTCARRSHRRGSPRAAAAPHPAHRGVRAARSRGRRHRRWTPRRGRQAAPRSGCPGLGSGRPEPGDAGRLHGHVVDRRRCARWWGSAA
jgi:cation transport ATPase